MFTFQVVDTSELLEKTYRFRYEIAHDELDRIESNDNKIETDEYDKYSIHFVALDNDGNICATVRGIFNSPIGYPTPKNLSTKLSIYENSDKNFAELSRIFIAKDVRTIKNSSYIIKNFLKLISYYIELYDVDYIYGGLEKSFIKLLHIMKVKFHVIGEASEYYGTRYPTVLVWEELVKDNPELKLTKEKVQIT
jgi:N-acyl-L-homoserine lactone synthetase